MKLALLCLFSAPLWAQCTASNQSGCPGSITTGAVAGSKPAITCIAGVALSSSPIALSGDVCYPVGMAAVAPMVVYYHGSDLTRASVWVNLSGVAMAGGLILTAERGVAAWSVDYAADTSGPLAKWQTGRCGLYYLKTHGGTISVPGNPNDMRLTGDSQGGFMALYVAQNGAGFTDSCDTAPVAISPKLVVSNDGPVNWARSDVLAGSTYDNTNATVQGIIQAILSSSSSATSKTADQNASFSTITYLPVAVPYYVTAGASDTYVPIAQNLAETATKYGGRWFSGTVLTGNHLGDANNPSGIWWPRIMSAIVSTSAVSAGSGFGGSGW